MRGNKAKFSRLAFYPIKFALRICRPPCAQRFDINSPVQKFRGRKSRERLGCDLPGLVKTIHSPITERQTRITVHRIGLDPHALSRCRRRLLEISGLAVSHCEVVAGDTIVRISPLVKLQSLDTLIQLAG